MKATVTTPGTWVYKFPKGNRDPLEDFCRSIARTKGMNRNKLQVKKVCSINRSYRLSWCDLVFKVTH